MPRYSNMERDFARRLGRFLDEQTDTNAFVKATVLRRYADHLATEHIKHTFGATPEERVKTIKHTGDFDRPPIICALCDCDDNPDNSA